MKGEGGITNFRMPFKSNGKNWGGEVVGESKDMFETREFLRDGEGNMIYNDTHLGGGRSVLNKADGLGSAPPLHCRRGCLP